MTFLMARLPVILVVIGVVVGLVACSSAGDKSLVTLVEMEPLNKTAAPAVTVSSVTTTAIVADLETGTRGELGSLDHSTIQDSGFQNFRREMILRFEPNSVAADSGPWRIESELAVLENPLTRVLEINYDGNGAVGDFRSMVVGQQEDAYFLHVPTVSCISTSRQDYERMISGIIDPDYFLGGMVGAPLIASSEVVNGQLAHHYSLEKQLLPRFADQDVSVLGRFYVAEEGHRPLQVLMEVSGEVDFAATGQVQDGTLFVEISWYELIDLGEVIIPPGCLVTDLYPLPEESYEVTSIADLVGYRVSRSIAEVVAFYEVEMAVAGWTAVEDPTILEDSAFMTFSRNGMEIIINVEAGSDDGDVSVVISP
ncbi:MAG TPA: hypothetical protein VMZ24_06005 [Patescibacteria group bacterium]|nr:hypothetical protein [Patescibacteria group bacterium]